MTDSRHAPTPPPELLARYEVAGPRYTSYPTVPVWRTDFGSDELIERLEAAAQKPAEEPLSLYVHLPFCKSLCWYCGCNVVIAKERSAADRYLDYLGRELELVAGRLGARRRLGQIHWGGGTPTFLQEDQLERLWGMLRRHFEPAADAEVAIEIHPALTRNAQLDCLRQLGFNRVSMGLQDFDPQVQQATNRIQTPEQTAALLEHARKIGFSGINFDLIYGLPHQNTESWAKTLELVLQMRPDRLAVYSFAHMPEVLKHQRRMPQDAMPRGDAKLALFRQAREAFLGAGYAPIGMDHFALPEDELSLAQERKTLWRNFQGYTVRAATDVVAFGSTGIGDVAGAYAQNVRTLSRYYERLDAGRLPTERGLRLTEDDLDRRALITHLMCNFELELGEAGRQRYAEEWDRLAPMEEDGLVARTGTRVEVTPLGRLFVRNVAMIFDSYLRPGQDRFSRTV